jgi:exodeoxyribonuclease VII small subunit
MPEENQLEQQSFEKVLARLEENVHALESGEVSLEEALELFEEGMRLSRDLNNRLTETERRIQELTRDSSGDPELRDLEVSGDAE